MSATPDSRLANPEQLIADLQRQLAECKAERDEAFEQQTATAEVLQVINSSSGDLKPVYDAILEKALWLCQAAFGVMRTYDGTCFRPVATRGLPSRYAEYLTMSLDQPGPDSPSQRIVDGENLLHVTDVTQEERYLSGHPYTRALVDLGGARSVIVVALRKDSILLGTITIYRQEARPFTDNQIALLQNFAAQAVIAMENARLITETREALEQQTATAEVLRTIANSPAEAERALDTIAQVTGRLFEASNVNIRRLDGNILRYAASFGASAADSPSVRTRGPSDGTSADP